MQKNKLFFFLLFSSNIFAVEYGELFFQGNCKTCHHKTKSISAPSMKLIQDTYKRAFPSQKEFVKYMSNWVAHPNTQTSLMHQAIQKYSLMPELVFDKETLQTISRYIYNTKFQKNNYE